MATVLCVHHTQVAKSSYAAMTPSARYNMDTWVTAWLRLLGSALNDRCQTPVLVVEEVYNKSLIDWVSGQYGETFHECAVFSLAFVSGKYLCTLMQCLAILTTNPVNKIYVLRAYYDYGTGTNF